jgi:hypothetical protein
MRRPKVVSKEGVSMRPEFVKEMLPASVRFLDALRALPRGSSKPLTDEEQRILDAALWLESLTGKPFGNAAIVTALANVPPSIPRVRLAYDFAQEGPRRE